MCDNFKKGVVKSIINEIKADTLVVESLKQHYAINIHKCINADDVSFDKCQKNYINSQQIIKGAWCTLCGKGMCENCMPSHFITKAGADGSCIHCRIQNENVFVECPKCHTPITVDKYVKTHGICIKCKIMILIK